MQPPLKKGARSQRQLRVGEEVRHALAHVFQRGDIVWPDTIPATARMVTVTEVRISPDLHNATAFVIPLGGQHADAVVDFLNNTVGLFRHAIGKAVRLRVVPRLTFMADTQFDKAEAIETLLRADDVRRDLD